MGHHMVALSRNVRRAVLAVVFNTIVSLTLIGAPQLARATTCTSSPTTFTALQAAFAAATSGGTTICLGASITGPTNDTVTGGNLTIPASASVVLDLSSYSLTVTPASTSSLAAITVPVGSTFELDATGGGTLNVTGAPNGAGIGSNVNSSTVLSTGNITITAGTVTAQGGHWAAGIGGGSHVKSGSITISGGSVTSTGGDGAAGIGGGFDRDGGDVTITGGTVTATGVNSGPGIGGGWSWHTVNSFTMTGGIVTASATSSESGLSVGGTSAHGSFIMSGGTLNVTGNVNNQYDLHPALYIAGTSNTISGGTITATAAGTYAADGVVIGDGVVSTLNMTGGSLTAIGLTTGGTGGAGIATWTNGSTLSLPVASGTVVNTGSGFGTGTDTAIPISTALSSSSQSFSMTGTQDATSTLNAQTLIVFGGSSGSSSSSNSSTTSSTGSTGSSSASSSSATQSSALAATGTEPLWPLLAAAIMLLAGVGMVRRCSRQQ